MAIQRRFAVARHHATERRLPRVPPTVQGIEVFKERSVAATGWVLSIPTLDLGVPVLRIDELNDVELYFYHYAVSRQMPEGAAPPEGASNPATSRVVPFPSKFEKSIAKGNYHQPPQCRPSCRPLCPLSYACSPAGAESF